MFLHTRMCYLQSGVACSVAKLYSVQFFCLGDLRTVNHWTMRISCLFCEDETVKTMSVTASSGVYPHRLSLKGFLRLGSILSKERMQNVTRPKRYLENLRMVNVFRLTSCRAWRFDCLKPNRKPFYVDSVSLYNEQLTVSARGRAVTSSVVAATTSARSGRAGGRRSAAVTTCRASSQT